MFLGSTLSSIKYIFDKIYNIFYLKDQLDFIVDEKIKMMNKVYKKEEVISLDYFEKGIIKNFYSYRSEKVIYMVVNRNTSEIIVDTIKINFPNGISISSDDLNKLNNFLKEEINYEISNSHALASLLERMNFCLIDRGKYLFRDFAKKLDDELASKIINYIESSKDVILYSTIYLKFEDELNHLGITNRYYLKGILDELLPDTFLTKRDYITLKADFRSAQETMKDFILSQDYIDFDSFKEKFPGVKLSVFVTLTYLLYPDLIQSSYGNEYVKFSSLNISKEFKDYFLTLIDRIFKSSDNKFVMGAKLYDIASKEKKYLLENLGKANNYFGLYNVLKVLFHDKFQFKRPFIYEGDYDFSFNNSLENYLERIDFLIKK